MGEWRNDREKIVNLKRNVAMELSKAQESSGMTQEELADKVGIDGSEIYQIESAKSNPSIEILEKIADSNKNFRIIRIYRATSMASVNKLNTP